MKMKLDHLEVEIEGGLLLLLPAEVPLIVGTQLLQNICYLCPLHVICAAARLKKVSDYISTSIFTITTYISPPGRPSNYPRSRPFSDLSVPSPLFQPRWTIMIFEDQWSSKITASSFIWSKNLQRKIPSNPVVQCFGPSLKFSLLWNFDCWGVWSHVSLWLSNLAFFAFLCL